MSKQFNIGDFVCVGTNGERGKIVNKFKPLGTYPLYTVQSLYDGKIMTAAKHELVKGQPNDEFHELFNEYNIETLFGNCSESATEVNNSSNMFNATEDNGYTELFDVWDPEPSPSFDINANSEMQSTDTITAASNLMNIDHETNQTPHETNRILHETNQISHETNHHPHETNRSSPINRIPHETNRNSTSNRIPHETSQSPPSTESIKPTEAATSTAETSRFIEMDSGDIDNFLKQSENENTRRKTLGHIQLFSSFLGKSKGRSVRSTNFHQMS